MLRNISQYFVFKNAQAPRGRLEFFLNISNKIFIVNKTTEQQQNANLYTLCVFLRIYLHKQSNSRWLEIMCQQHGAVVRFK